MVNFPTQIPDCDSHRTALLDFFLSFDASICSTMAFPRQGNSDIVVSVFMDFPSKSKWDTLFYHIAYDYSHADWDSLCYYLRDVPWEDTFKLKCFCCCEFCEWVQVAIDVCIPHCKYQVKPHSSPQFFSDCNIANIVLSKGKSEIPLLFNGPEVLFSASDKAKLFPKNFSKNSYPENSGKLIQDCVIFLRLPRLLKRS